MNFIIPLDLLYLVYVCLCLGLRLLMSNLSNVAIFFFNRHQQYTKKIMHEESKCFPNSKSSAAGHCLAFAYFFANFGLVLLEKCCLY